MHAEAFAFVQTVVTAHGVPASVVEIGARCINGSIRPLFHGAAYTGIDIAPGLWVDVVADGATWQPPAPVDCVVCCEVFEHAEQAAAICANAAAMLRPGGRFIVTAASDPRPPHSGIDGGPLRPGEFYRNVSADELLAWLGPHFAMSHIGTDPRRGDIRAVAIRD